MTRRFLAISVIAFAPGLALAQEPQACNFETNSGAITTSYEQIGTDACVALCSATDGCTAWLYTPHNFSPDTAPGECILYEEASGIREPDSSAPNQFCGQMGG